MVEPQWSPFRVWTGVGPLQETLFLNEVYISNPEEEALLIGDVSTYCPLKNVGRFRVADDESIYPLTVALLGCVASRLVIG